MGFLIPTGAGLLFGGDKDHNEELVLGISRGTAVILLLWCVQGWGELYLQARITP